MTRLIVQNLIDKMWQVFNLYLKQQQPTDQISYSMVLGQLSALQKLMNPETKPRFCKRLSKHLELSRLEVVQLFHVSPVRNRTSILSYGLVPKSKTEGLLITYEPRVFVSSVYEEAAFDYVSFEDVDVWSFYMPKQFLYVDEFSDYANHYYIKVAVPWYKLTLLETR